MMHIDHYMMLTCQFKEENMKWFFAIVRLTTLEKYDTISLWCKWCNHIHVYDMDENDDIICRTE